MWMLLLLACGGPAADPAPAEHPANATAEPDWRERFCTPRCGNEIVLHRDDVGAVQVVHTSHGIGCMRAPNRYMRPDGSALVTFSHRPTTPEKAEALRAERDALLEGLTADAPLRCPGGDSPQNRHFDAKWTDLACPEQCAGRVHVWMDDTHVRLLHHEADTDACSHPTDVWLDTDGKELLAVRFEPVGREEAAAIQARIQALKEGLVEDRTIDCPDEE